jgi:hypothetical protein
MDGCYGHSWKRPVSSKVPGYEIYLVPSHEERWDLVRNGWRIDFDIHGQKEVHKLEELPN